jgi:biopolymer transport protein ExbD
MKKLNYLNGVLTVIAVCLVIITLSVLKLIPAANANPNNRATINLPVNADGTINVNINAVAGQEIKKKEGISASGSIPTRPDK